MSKDPYTQKKRSLYVNEGVELILKNGDLYEMRNIIDLAKPYGDTTWNELVLIFCGIYCSFRGYIKSYSESWYLLSEKGLAKKANL